MDIETSEAVKLFFPSPSLKLIYYEALANSLDANATQIKIETYIESFDKPETLRVTIVDNGDGFNDESFNRFKTLLRPRDEFHKGIGRLVFLKYFASVSVDSSWGKLCRKFLFKEGFDGENDFESLQSNSLKSTKLVFSNFLNSKIHSYDDLKPDNLKGLVKEQFLPTLDAKSRAGIDFEISFSLSTKEENPQKEFFNNEVVLTKKDLPSFIRHEVNDPTIDGFEPIYILYNIDAQAIVSSLFTAFNIDGRTIPVNIIQKNALPIGHSCIFLFESKIFHASSDSSRQSLILPNGLTEAYLHKCLRVEIGKILDSAIPQIRERNQKTMSELVDKFPHLNGLFESKSVGLISQDDALQNAQQQFFLQEKKILQCETLSDEDYDKSLELSSRVLTEYILYREKIIQRMKEKTSDDDEASIHDLIVPRYKEFVGEDGLELYQNNAWLLDDKFMVFRTILSEGRLDRVIQEILSEEEKSTNYAGRPDISMIFSANPDDAVPVDVVVVEVKKKSDNEKENQYAINQLLQRARKLVSHCDNIQRIWYYAVTQLDEEFKQSLVQQKFSALFSKGEVYYQEYETPHPTNGKKIPTPTFIVSFDTIVADAEARNHTFLGILREGMKKYGERYE